MTPDQEQMLSFVYHAVFGAELGIVIGFAFLVLAAIAGFVSGRIRKWRERRREKREMDIPKHIRRD